VAILAIPRTMMTTRTVATPVIRTTTTMATAPVAWRCDQPGHAGPGAGGKA
jgi:hypothetical protein